MHRLAVAAIVLMFGLLVGGGAVYVFRPGPAADEAAIRTVVAEVLQQRDAETSGQINLPPLDAATIDPMIEDYLMSNPRILQRMSDALNTEMRTAEANANKASIGKLKDAIFNDPDQIVVGNPDGDVTLVEMFDYNCGYCRGALPDLATLIAEDSNLRVVLKEFPILSKESVDAARVAVLVARNDADYWSFHQKLFTGRGQVNVDTALAAAKDLGLDPATLQPDIESDAVSQVIQKSYDIAKELNITGTPTYIIGDELIPGAVPIEQLRSRIANMRACGSTQCAASQT